MRKLAFLSLILLAVLAGCRKDHLITSPPADSYSSALLHPWLELQLSFIKRDGGFTPPVASRTLGYCGFAVYESVAGGMPGNKSIASQVGAPAMPLADVNNTPYNWSLVASATWAEMLRKLFIYTGGPRNSAVQFSIDSLYNLQKQELASGLGAEIIQNSENYGLSVARAVYAWSETDPVGHLGQTKNNDASFVAPVVPGAWVPTPPAFAAPVQPNWGSARTFHSANKSGICLPSNPLTYSTSNISPFYAQALEVYSTVNSLSAEQRTIALFWADGGGSITPPGHMMNICRQALKSNNSPLGFSAEAYCRVGMAVADAFVSCWKGKYSHYIMRPVTYIRTNIDAGWSPLIGTPPFPGYASGHSSQSGAAARVMSDIFGYNFSFTDHTHDANGFVPRNFSSFFDAAQEAAVSRLYGGIHFRMDNEAGFNAGVNVGKNISGIRFR